MLDKELLNYVRDKKSYIIFLVVFNVLGLLINVSLTFLVCFMIKDFINGSFQDGLIKSSIILILAISKVVIITITSKLSRDLSNFVVEKLRSDTYQKFLKVHGKTPFSVQEMAQLSTEGIEQLRLYYSVYLPSFFFALIAPLILFTIFAFIDLPVAFIYLASVPLIPISIVLVSKWAKKIFNKYWDKYTSLGDSFLDNVSGMKELKIFGYAKNKAKEMMNESEEFRKITMKVLTMQLASITIMDLVAYGGAALGIIFSLVAMQNGLSVYLTLFMILIGAEFFLPLRALGSAFHVAMNGATAGKKVMKLLETEDYIDGTKEVKNIYSIELKNVAFKYEENDVLKGINLSLKKGFNSIVGLSGSGKSTIAKLLSKTIKTDEGIVLINDENIDEISSKSFYKKACYISNNTFVFHRSIRESFKFYNPEITEEKMIKLLEEMKLGHLDLDFKINDQVSNISGGEKQRLVLAFYLSKEYDFYIFDEATSNIDIESEEIILNKIHEIAKTKIVLFITHRLKNVTKSLAISYLKDGLMIENGTFEGLMNKETEFKKLYLYQDELERGGRYEKA